MLTREYLIDVINGVVVRLAGKGIFVEAQPIYDAIIEEHDELIGRHGEDQRWIEPEPDLLPGFYKFFNEESGEEFGSFEVLHITEAFSDEHDPGFYWWSCFPGCVPDGDGVPNGPFATAREAYNDARSS